MLDECIAPQSEVIRAIMLGDSPCAPEGGAQRGLPG